MKRLILLLVCLTAGVLTTSTEASAQKIATVNSKTILDNLPEFKEAQTRIEAIRTAYQDTVDMLQQQLETEYQAYQKQSGIMSDEAKAQAEERLRQIQSTGLQYQQLSQQIQGEILAPIRQRILDAIKAVAGQNKLTAVVEDTTFLYVDPGVDITFDVLKQIKSGK